MPATVIRFEYDPYRTANIMLIEYEDKKVLEGVFEGETINTPSMLCVEDCVDALLWIESIGGLEGAIKRSKKNLEEVKFFVKENKEWIDFLAEKENSI